MTTETTFNKDAFEPMLQNTSKFIKALQVIETESTFTGTNSLIMLVWNNDTSIMYRTSLTTKRDKNNSSPKAFYGRVTHSFEILNSVYAVIGFKKLIIVLSNGCGNTKNYEYNDVKSGWVDMDALPIHPFWTIEIYFELPDHESIPYKVFAGGFDMFGKTLTLKVMTLGCDARKEFFDKLIF